MNMNKPKTLEDLINEIGVEYNGCLESGINLENIIRDTAKFVIESVRPEHDKSKFIGLDIKWVAGYMDCYRNEFDLKAKKLMGEEAGK